MLASTQEKCSLKICSRQHVRSDCQASQHFCAVETMSDKQALLCLCCCDVKTHCNDVLPCARAEDEQFKIHCNDLLPCARAEDEQFREEKGVIIKEISMLDGPPGESQASDTSARHVW